MTEITIRLEEVNIYLLKLSLMTNIKYQFLTRKKCNTITTVFCATPSSDHQIDKFDLSELIQEFSIVQIQCRNILKAPFDVGQ